MFIHSFWGPPINARGVKKGSKPQMSAKKKLRGQSINAKKPGIPGFFDGSGDWIRTNDRSGMKMGKGQKLKMSENLKNLDI